MSYKCPLCLKVIGADDRIVRCCTDHPHTGQTLVLFHEAEDTLPDNIFCPEGDGRCNETVETGVFLRHVDCQAKNPFWDGQAITIPGSDSTLTYQLDTPSGPQNIPVTHWEIGMLRNMPHDAEEMWFPLMLFRATGETHANDKRVGSLVELAGTSTVGKTVLAMQAMEYDGYTPSTSSDERHIEVIGYIFSRLPAGRTAITNPFLGTLYLNNLMRSNRNGLFPIPGTFRMPGDLKVAFIAPSKNSEKEAGQTSAEPHAAQNSKGFFGRVKSQVGTLLSGLFGTLKSQSHRHSFWYTVAFYDVAGEAFVVGDGTPDAIERAADRVAILVDAEDIFGTKTGGDSIAVANDRIRKANERRLPCCLVITKLDLVMSRLSLDEQTQVREIAEDLKNDRTGEARTFLKTWLEQQIANESVKELKNRLRTIGQVFFVWTENLPTTTLQGVVHTSARQPSSYGLVKFICWCLNVQWDDINQK